MNGAEGAGVTPEHGEEKEALSKRVPDSTYTRWLEWYDTELTKQLTEGP